jgi:hypothetical protein
MNRRARTFLASSACAAVLWAGVAASASAAGPIYRCGNEYSNTPCPGGTALESSDTRSEAQRAEARRVVAEDKRRAAAQERERLAEAGRNPPALAAGIEPKKVRAADNAASKPERGKLSLRSARKKAEKHADRETTDFIAVQPAPPKKPRSTAP